MYAVVLTLSARRFFEDADGGFQRKLDRCFLYLANDPRRHNNMKPLKGRFSGYLRYRIGDSRGLAHR